MPVIEAVRWSPEHDAVRVIDQTLLPERLVERDLRTLEESCDAIRRLVVRGAPAIGVAGAMALVVSLMPFAGLPRADFLERARAHAARLAATRPTAVNLSWALQRLIRRVDDMADAPGDQLGAIRAEATAILEEDRAMCRRIGEYGLTLMPAGPAEAHVLTHCNAGALATSGIGTALAPVYIAAERGRAVSVIVGETRPVLQGARLTAWELSRASIPVTVVTDSAVASLMRAGRIDLVIVGADRIAANGDTANKVGTYALAVLARAHGISFHVAAPTSTFDPRLADGTEIVIEQRERAEVAGAPGALAVPPEAEVENPAFDVTPAGLITSVISDRGVHRPPFDFHVS
ncbi:MAG TPA: S-methyl-5-thioribose-1-phosphate isomerase [Gemmatimonadaceae bacterium]|nr:S-methyl-5-thioribose-1-phosphate isomerase [Gemmatimonadaceae bacterium]